MAESGQTLGPYVLEAPLGGSSSTFRAQHRERQQWVCLKVLPGSLREDAARLQQRQRKALATGYLQHPGLVRTLDFAEVEGQICVVTEYVDGEPLAALLAAGTPPLSQSLRILRAAGEALGAAHDANVAHGGLEPEKILLGPAGAHVAGIGGRDDDGALNPGDEAPTDVDHCTAPERYRGLPESPAADVWSLGAILYRCLKGAYPFAATSRRELAHLVHAGSFHSPTYALIAFQAAVDRVLQTALNPDPAARYEDGAKFARAIAELESMALPELRHAPPAASTSLGIAAPSAATFGVASPAQEAAPPRPFDDPFASGIPPSAYSLGASYDVSATVPAPPPLPPDAETEDEPLGAEGPPSAAVTAPPSFGAVPMTPPDDDEDEIAVAVEEVAPPATEAPLELVPPPLAAQDESPPAAPLPPASPAATAVPPKGSGGPKAWLGIAAAAVALMAVVVADPLGVRGSGDGAAPTSPMTIADQGPTGTGEGDVTPPKMPAVSTPTLAPEGADASAAPVVDAGAAPVVDAVAAVDDMAGNVDRAPPPESPPQTEATATPEGLYAAARDVLEETIAARNLLWTDDRTLDKFRLQSRKDAKKKDFEKATAAAKKGLAAAKAVKINDKFVKRKLLRYLKRRRALPKGDAKEQAIAAENDARKLLKTGDVEEANRLLSDGLRKMYVEREAEGASEGSAKSSDGEKAPAGPAGSAAGTGGETAPTEDSPSASPTETGENEPGTATQKPPAEKAPVPSPSEPPEKAEAAGETAP